MAVDLLKEVSQMNTNEKAAFFAIRDAMDYKDDTLSNISVDQKNYTPYQKKVFKNKPQFLMIGKGVNMKNENMAVDLLKEVSQMNTYFTM